MCTAKDQRNNNDRVFRFDELEEERGRANVADGTFRPGRSASKRDANKVIESSKRDFIVHCCRPLRLRLRSRSVCAPRVHLIAF